MMFQKSQSTIDGIRRPLQLCLTIAILLLSMAFPAEAESLYGKVIHVADGDTLSVIDSTYAKHIIRLSGIDAPEKRQAFGQVSKRSLVDQVAGRNVNVEWSKQDRYGRKVGKIVLDGQDINLVQIQRGLAWHYKQYEREQNQSDRDLYSRAEIGARSAKIGLWRDADPLPPWEFRKAGKQPIFSSQ